MLRRGCTKEWRATSRRFVCEPTTWSSDAPRIASRDVARRATSSSPTAFRSWCSVATRCCIPTELGSARRRRLPQRAHRDQQLRGRMGADPSLDARSDDAADALHRLFSRRREPRVVPHRSARSSTCRRSIRSSRVHLDHPLLESTVPYAPEPLADPARRGISSSACASRARAVLARNERRRSARAGRGASRARGSGSGDARGRGARAATARDDRDRREQGELHRDARARATGGSRRALGACLPSEIARRRVTKRRSDAARRCSMRERI